MEKPFWSALKIPLHQYYCYYIHYVWFLVWYKENKFECHAALRSLFILILRPLTLALEKKYFYNFPLSSLRHGVSKEKTKYHFSTTFTTADILIATTSTMLWLTEKYIFSFQHYCVRYTMIKKIYLSPIVNCYYPTASWLCQKKYFSYSYYVHYAVIMAKVCFHFSAVCATSWSWQKTCSFNSVLHSLGPNHEKKIFSYCYYVNYICDHDKKIFLCCCYFHYAVVSAMSTMLWL